MTIMITEKWTSCWSGIWSCTSRLSPVFRTPPKPQCVRWVGPHLKPQNGWEDLHCYLLHWLNLNPSFCTLFESFFFPSDTREFTNHGGPAAGWAAICSESHHSVHDCLSARRGTKLKLSAGTERPRDVRIKKSQQQTVKWDKSSTFNGHRAPSFRSCASWLCFSFSQI